jgi:putative oxidoreductase
MLSQTLSQNFNLTDPFNILRIICGVFFLPHMVAKFTQQEFALGFYEKVRFRPGRAWLYASLAIEVVVAPALILGIYTRYAALLGAAFLFVAAFAVHRFAEGKWLWNLGGYEYPLFWGICCVVVAMHG